MTPSEKATRSKIRKMAKGNHTRYTIKAALGIGSEWDQFIDAELQKKSNRIAAQPTYSGRNIRYQ